MGSVLERSKPGPSKVRREAELREERLVTLLEKGRSGTVNVMVAIATLGASSMRRAALAGRCRWDRAEEVQHLRVDAVDE